MSTSSTTVAAKRVRRGDKINIYSARARGPREVRVKEAHHFHDHTTLELVGLPPIKLNPETPVIVTG